MGLAALGVPLAAFLTAYIGYTGAAWARVVAEVAAPLDLTRHTDVPDIPALDRFQATHLLPTNAVNIPLNRWQRRLDDAFTGTHHGQAVQVMIGWMGIPGKDGRTAFGGLLAILPQPTPRAGTVTVRSVHDGGYGQTRVTTGDPAFDGRFHLYADNPDAARTLAGPRLRETLLALQSTLWARCGALRAVFGQGDVLVAFEKGTTAFSPPSPWLDRAAAVADLNRLIAAITLPHRLLDALEADHANAPPTP